MAFWIVASALLVFIIVQTVRIVPQQTAFVVERLGKYHRTLDAGLHIVIPLVDVVRYRHSLKEIVLDIPEQICITRDNVQVAVDGVIFFRVMDPKRASYGVSYFEQAVTQLAQTTLRSEIGKMDLDTSFEEREKINNAILLALDQASDPWGVKVLRYEIKSINPPRDVLDAMEKQMRAEREKRAKILESEGDRDARINRAEGNKQEVIKSSEADRMRQMNEAEGQASAILAVAKATSDGLSLIAKSLADSGGKDAAQLRVAEAYVKELGRITANSTTLVVPNNISDLSGMMASAFGLYKGQNNNTHT